MRVLYVSSILAEDARLDVDAVGVGVHQGPDLPRVALREFGRRRRIARPMWCGITWTREGC